MVFGFPWLGENSKISDKQAFLVPPDLSAPHLHRRLWLWWRTLIILTYNRDLSGHCTVTTKIVLTPSACYFIVYSVLCLIPNGALSSLLTILQQRHLYGFRKQLQLLYLSVINGSSLGNFCVF